ncbi:MAG: TraM recognition domain-containing protein [Bacteroidales bacterium]|nr:TraM recognition domain-containing protein [Bacteroidales bacterium]
MNPEFSLRRMIQTGAGLGALSTAAFLAERGNPNDQFGVLVGGLGGLGLMAHATLGNVKQRMVPSKPPANPLDRVLLHWDAENPFTLRHLLDGGVSIFGRTGSGKTSSSGKAIGRAILRVPGSGGLICAAKPGDISMWRLMFREAGREDDLLVFSPEHPLRFNLLDYECRSGGGITRNLAKCLMVTGENLRSGEQDNSGDSAFWRRESERMLFCCIEIVKLATGGVSAPDLHRFLSGAAASPQDIGSEAFLAGFHNQCLKAAWHKPKSPMEKHDFELAKDYFLSELPNMADRTKTSIMVHVFGILHTMNQGLVRELLSTTTNVSPDDMFRGRFLFLDMPISEYAETGAFVNGAIKYATQKAILRREASDATPPVVLWLDEAHTLATSQDAHFLAQCRSHHGCMVYLSQSLPGYINAIGGEHAKAAVDALQSSVTTKIFHALGDLETAQWASGLVGKELRTFIGGSMAHPEGGVYEELTGQAKYTSNFSQHMDNTLEVNAFLHNLRTGGQANDFMCDAIVLRTGEPFASGENFLRTSFSQKG